MTNCSMLTLFGGTSCFLQHDGANGELSDVEIKKLVGAMETGNKVMKVRLAKQLTPTHSRLLRLNYEAGILILHKNDNPTKHSTHRPKYIDVSEIREFSTLECKLGHSKLGEKWKKDRDLSCFDASKVMMIYHGSHFVLELLIFVFENSDAARLWSIGLRHLRIESLRLLYPVTVKRWLQKEFSKMESPTTNCISVKDLKPFLRKVHCQIDSKRFRELVQKSLKASSANSSADSVFGLKEKVSFDSFGILYRNLIYVHSLSSSLFSQYLDEDMRVGLKAFLMFLHDEQDEEMAKSEAVLKEWFHAYVNSIDLSRESDPYLTKEEFLDYLFSGHNSIWDSENNRVYQDMNQPLSHYWIASSHNTYLTGDQLKSESTLEAYARALLMGCRSIELDCWDGVEGSPHEIIIYHGYTLTSKLQFPDVLRTIRAYAFVTSDYPVILSIEDNCSLPFQRQMAQYFRDILGDLLLTSPINPELNQLPSPSDLKRKIILKHKKLPRDTDRSHSISSSSNVSMDESMLSQDQTLLTHPDTQKKGVLHMRDPASQHWNPHIFVLTSDRLYYSDDTNALLGQQAEAPAACEPTVTTEDEEALSASPDELHLSEMWFHGKISRELAEKLLKDNLHAGDGLFLVRESTTFPGDFSLSFSFRNLIHHCRIKTVQIAGERKYYLLEKHKMDTLFELISYYQERPLNTPKFTTVLKTPCPQFSVHEGKPWFAGDISRTKAEEMLNQYPQDGAFLIRNSQSDTATFTLSFRVDGMIKHCRLKQEGRLFIVGNSQFEDIVSLVDYYFKHQLFHGVCLKFPVNKETIENYSMNTSYMQVGAYMELQNVAAALKARAKFDYVAREDEELSFPANAILSNVVQDDAEWWLGDYQGKRGYFPKSYVEELSNEAAVLSSINGVEPEPLGFVELAGCILECAPAESTREFAFIIRNPSSSAEEVILHVASETLEDMADWKNSIMEVTRNANDKIAKIRRKENVLRIASDLSDLVVYCQAVTFNPSKIPGQCYEMCSYSDSKHEKYAERGIVRYSQNQISRVYPNASRLTSNNFFPMPMWNAGCQMVALNYQTPDKPMQLNQGRFLDNGQCGYVLKPPYMNLEFYSPFDKKTIAGSQPITLTIQVIAGRHLFRRDKSKGTVSPYVEVELLGYYCDNMTYRTDASSANGLNPVWPSTAPFEFDVLCPEMALLRFSVQDEDFLGNDPFIGQAVFPLSRIRSGYRSVPLKNAYNEELELSSLLVHINKRKQSGDDVTRLNSVSHMHHLKLQQQSEEKRKRLSPQSSLVSHNSSASFNGSAAAHCGLNSCESEPVAVSKLSTGSSCSFRSNISSTQSCAADFNAGGENGAKASSGGDEPQSDRTQEDQSGKHKGFKRLFKMKTKN